MTALVIEGSNQEIPLNVWLNCQLQQCLHSIGRELEAHPPKEINS